MAIRRRHSSPPKGISALGRFEADRHVRADQFAPQGLALGPAVELDDLGLEPGDIGADGGVQLGGWRTPDLRRLGLRLLEPDDIAHRLGPSA